MMVPDIKLVLLGSRNTGKTCLLSRYVYIEWAGETATTIGPYFETKQLRSNDQEVFLAIWDTAGEEKFNSLTNLYCRGAKAALVCYDITAAESFHQLHDWVKQVSLEAEGCVIIVVGNKLDLVLEEPLLREVSPEEAQRFAAGINAVAFECSAKTDTNVGPIFEKAVQLVFERHGTNLGNNTKNAVDPAARRKQHESGCC